MAPSPQRWLSQSGSSQFVRPSPSSSPGGVVRFGRNDPADTAYTFPRTINFNEGQTGAVSFGLFNADVGLDLVFVDRSTDDDRLGIIIGDGSGTFSPPTYFAAGDGSGFLYVYDFNEDGDLDVVMTANGALL